jgi:hypothetical protein
MREPLLPTTTLQPTPLQPIVEPGEDPTAMQSAWQEPESGDIAASFMPTFRHMVTRRLERELGGTIRQPHKLRTLTSTVFVCLCFGMMGLSIRDGVQVTFSTEVAPLFSIILLCLLFVAISSLEVLRWVILWVLLGAVALLFVSLAEGYHITGFFDFSTRGSLLRLIVVAVDIALIVLTLVAWILLFLLYPALLQCALPPRLASPCPATFFENRSPRAGSASSARPT